MKDDKPRVDLRYLVYYTLLWIAYIEDYYKIYKIPKVRYSKFLERTKWNSGEEKFRNTKFIYG